MVILLPSQARAFLKQCSRQTPAPGEGAWRPAAADIRRFEADLGKALRDRGPNDGQKWLSFPKTWRRQYVGVVRHGRRFIEGNFFPKGEANAFPHWATAAVMVCDGGPEFFGAEYDASAHGITQVAFNSDA